METIYLEHWVHDVIRRQARGDAELGRFLGRDSLSTVTRADIDRYHLYKLRKVLAYVYEKSTGYRELFDRQGIKADRVESLEDLSRIPFTGPADIARHPYHFACVSLAEIERATTFTSSGTTGPRKRVFFTERDLETITDFMAAGMRTVTNPGDVVQIMLPSGRPNDQADLLSKGVMKMGGVPVVTGTVPTSEAQLRTMAQNHPAVLFAAVSRMYRITQETRHTHDLKSLGVRTVFVTSEYLADSMRDQLRDAWGCDVHAHYGMTEMGLAVAVQCHAHDGFHVNGADLLVEVIDPKTGAVLGDDADGELVFTSLSLEAMPLIRYRTHDITRFIGSPCPCGGQTLKRIDRVTRRREAVVRVGDGDELYPALLDELIFALPDIIEYKAALAREGGKDVLLLQVEVSRYGKVTEAAVREALLGDPVVRRNVAADRLVLSRIDRVPQGTLVRLNRAKKLIADSR